MNNWCYDNNFTISTTGADNLVFADGSDVTGDVWLNNELEWLPEACQWKKYWPIWHLKVSYNSA